MRRLKNLNIAKSIERNQLVYSEDWLDKFDTIIIYMFFTWCFIMPFLVYFNPYRDYSKTGIEFYLLFIFSIYALYVIYRKATEKNLRKIVSQFDAEKNRSLINEYCKEKGFEKYRDAKNIIIYNNLNYLAINPRFQTSRIFILEKNDIYLTMIKENQKLNIPVLFSQNNLMRDINQLCK